MAAKQRPFKEQLFLFILLLPFHALYGLYVAIRAACAAPNRIRGTLAACAPTVRCPSGHENSTIGRYECGACRAVYHGWVGRCGLCGAPAGWMPCDHCGVAIALPWERR